MRRTILPLLFLFTLFGCKSDFNAFEEKASDFAKSGNSINLNEIKELKDFISDFSNERAFSSFFTAGSPDDQKLFYYLEKKRYKIEKEKAISLKDIAVNVYIENTGSMNGYVSTDTEFKNAITELIVRLNETYDSAKINLKFINTEIYPIKIKGNPAKYPAGLNSQKMKVGDITKSDLNEIFEKILNKTSGDTISILISDCIYSVSGNNTAGKLDIQKSLTKDVFQKSLEKNKNSAIVVFKLNSAFIGTYYTKNNTKVSLKKEPRPYFFTIMGSSGQIADFDKNINIEEIKGYENKLVLSSADYSKEIYYSVINAKNDSGRFKTSRGFSNKNSIKGIEDISVDSRNGAKFSFSVAVDLSRLPLEEDYIRNPKNYTIDEGDFSVFKITEFNKQDLAPGSATKILKSGNNPTHYITFISTSGKYSDLVFSLQRKMPEWVDETNTEDDTDIKSIPNKTFGFKYLMEGINEAYLTASPSKNYFKLKITINP